MKKTILILLLLISFSVSSQEIKKKCVTITEKKLPNYKVKVIKTNHCVEPKEITIRTYITTEWEKKKRKKRKKRKNEK
ncbi:hypothetical protein [Phenylobacterium sp.]|mgnify:FL=1|jgi:hypothetical protein|uniref:hypothetical protein n=1 Tax=Phenylobacterium sp. TaxID=1871053 RepID=UPI0025E3DC7C|nr:hypothetical protein [Phenylobacterium sp.]|tara:strand:+ start:3152 stop:3385 length:234 start_codon:yes stop_codon:yes gene_type:complete